MMGLGLVFCRSGLRGEAAQMHPRTVWVRPRAARRNTDVCGTLWTRVPSEWMLPVVQEVPSTWPSESIQPYVRAYYFTCHLSDMDHESNSCLSDPTRWHRTATRCIAEPLHRFRYGIPHDDSGTPSMVIDVCGSFG